MAALRRLHAYSIDLYRRTNLASATESVGPVLRRMGGRPDPWSIPPRGQPQFANWCREDRCDRPQLGLGSGDNHHTMKVS